MEEVDKILIQSLREIDCQIDDGIQRINEFKVDTLFGCVARCLNLIITDKEISLRLPPNISTRFKICGELARLCQSIGYKGDIGYQTFLSINENETRTLLNFLIEKIPREAAVTAASASLDPWEALERAISVKIMKDLTSSSWMPHDLVTDLCRVSVHHPAAQFAHNRGITATYRSQVSTIHIPPQSDKRKLASHVSPFVFDQVELKNLANCLLYENQVSCWIEKQSDSNYFIPGQTRKHQLSKEIRQTIEEGEALGSKYRLANREENNKKNDDLLTRSRFMHTNANAHDQLNSNQDQNQRKVVDQSEELENLKHLTGENEEVINELESKLKSYEQSIEKYKRITDESRTEIERLTKEIELKRKTSDYLLSIDPESGRLQNAIEKVKNKLKKLDEKWDEIQRELFQRRDELKKILDQRKSKIDEINEEINEIKAKGNSILTETKEKDQILARLHQDYENHKENSSRNEQSRTAFTKQILDIVNNTNKQKGEITKTNIEIRTLQKELNNLTGKLERTFQEADGKLFKNAKTDEFARRSYKMLANLHSDCEQIYRTIEEIGVIVREIRDCEDQIEVESQKNMTTNLETLIEEFRKIRDENNAIRARQN